MKNATLLVVFSLLGIVSKAQSTHLFESKFIEYGLVDIQHYDPSIQVRLMYSTTDNFTKIDMYGELERAYLVPEIAKILVVAQRKLKASYPKYSFIVLDAARPMSVQQSMHDLVAGTPEHIYVSNPKKGGGRHNYGTAVDVSIINDKGELLDMGSGFDFFGEESHVGNELDLIRRGRMSEQAAKNRKILSGLLKSAGLQQHPKEWWHFHKYTMDELKAKYKRLDF